MGEGRIFRGGELGKWGRVWDVFHELWGHCKESPEYDKEKWKNLQAQLQDIQEGMKDKRKADRRR